MEIKYHRNFYKDLQKNIPATRKDQLKIIINHIKQAQNIGELKNIKKLKGFLHNYAIRMGNYRLGLRYEDNTIILDRFLHRKEIYKKYP